MYGRLVMCSNGFGASLTLHQTVDNKRFASRIVNIFSELFRFIPSMTYRIRLFMYVYVSCNGGILHMELMCYSIEFDLRILWYRSVEVLLITVIRVYTLILDPRTVITTL